MDAPQPRRPPGDRRAGRPGRRGPAAQRGPPAGRRHRGRHRPADPAPPRADDRPTRPTPAGSRSERTRPSTSDAAVASTSTSPTTPSRCSASSALGHGLYGTANWSSRATGDIAGRRSAPRAATTSSTTPSGAGLTTAPRATATGRPGPRRRAARRTDRARRGLPRGRPPTAASPGSSTGSLTPHELPGDPGRRAARRCWAARHRGRAAGRRGRPSTGRHRRRSPQLRGELNRQLRRLRRRVRAAQPRTRCAPPAGSTRRPASRTHGPDPARQGGFRTDPYAPAVYALEIFDPPPRPRHARPTSSPAGRRAPRPAARRGHPEPTPWRSAWTPTARSASPRSPGCSASTETARPGRSSASWSSTTPTPGRLVPAAEYLSGNVRVKLAAARAAAERPTRAIAVNVAALTAVIPADLDPGARSPPASARPGSTPTTCRQFLPRPWTTRSIRVEHPGGSMWAVAAARTASGHTRPGAPTGCPAPQLAPVAARAAPGRSRSTTSSTTATRVLNLDRDPRRPGEGDRAGRPVRRLGLGRPGPRPSRLARVYNERSTRSCCAATTTSQLSLPGLARDLHAAPAPGRRGRPDDRRAGGRAVPRGRRRQDRRDGDGLHGAAPPRAGAQTGHRRPQPHARAVRPRVPAALPAGPAARRRPPTT